MTLHRLFALLVLTVAAACGREAAPEAGSQPAEGAPLFGGTAELARRRVQGDLALTGAERVQANTPAPRPAPSQAADSVASRLAGTMLIRNGDVSIRVDSLEPAMEAVRALAVRLGGVIGDVTIMGGERQVRSAELELRVPAARFDSAMTGLAPIGRVEHSATTAEDVGEEFTDLRARVGNSRRLEERLVTLLATRTGKLEDVLAVERELARVRGEIEQMEGRLRYLGARVAASTIHVRLSEKAPLVSEPGRSVLGEAFKAAWRNFVGLVSGAIASLGVVVPLVLVAWGGWRLLRRRRHARE